MSKSSIDFEIQKRLLERVFQKLDVPTPHRLSELTFNQNVQETLFKIEGEEKTWELRLDSESKVHGQKEVGEPIRFWSVPKDSAEFLAYFVMAVQPESILEIGTSVGYSTIHLAVGSNAPVTTLESLSNKAEMARENFERSGLQNIALVEGKAQDYLDTLPKSTIFDLVFLDADKENYGKYFDVIIEHVPVGGFIVADNVLDYGHEMQDFLSKVMGTKFAQSSSDQRVISYLLPIDNGLLIVKKIST